MKLTARLSAIPGPVSVPGLAAVWFADTAGAQGSHDHGSHSIHIGIPAQEFAVSVAHGVTLGAVVFLVGLVAFVALVWLPAGQTEADEREKVVGLFCRWMWVLAGLLIVAGLVELPLYAVRASGEALSFGLLREALLDTRVGQLWIERIAFGILTAAAATYAARLRRPVYWWTAAVPGALLLTTLTRQSHAAAEGGLLPFAADWLHVTAASLWMGGLLGFPILLIGPLRAMPTETRAKLLGRIVPRFSKVATMAVMGLVLTGLAAALLHVPSLSALVSTPYGRALSMKLGLLVFLLGLGAYNLRLRGREPFGRIVRAELVLAIGIFVVTGFLTSLPPADAVLPTAEENAATEEAASNVVVRISGTPGTAYSGIYGTIEETQTVEGTLKAEPAEYEVTVEDGVSGNVSAAFQKTRPADGTLKVEILAGGEVVAGREASPGSGTVAVSWSPQDRTTGGGP